ncbi:UDP-N-acetylenolpyruvoylglucosamine reductase [Legionella steigerwaltii]|uniref:UDP-N-acetylenolpyruvoylglucosamine reductase n=1 Tax=Legionella steigerwaltii TaxID=460 RepID=A0A378L909_9GAMM|nr:UDP-N-acetylmuramate dehydrogenase [Legionella steigerwaltii]KTD81114.1 UDP-N-acetylenolpyruvoylglucosamine reductase [Legionella steigerwaltii]STY23197.1 UDP-N-acetylenolpyruvoylglucosamine reductase [Legionella steigerwaltii]
MLNLQENVDLTPLNTLHLKSTASHYVVLDHIEQLDELCLLISRFPQFFVLGGGSNLIVPPTYQGLVIHNRLHGIKIIKNGKERIVTAMAGENWDEFVAYCTANGAFGLENLSLIPGTVGASPIQNIGAYGVEVKDFIEEVLAYDLQTAQLVTLSNNECNFSYRNSLLKNNSRYIVISVSFKLSNQSDLNLSYGDVAQRIASITNPTPHELRKIIIGIRQSKLPDPQELGNVGSFFHNPIVPQDYVQKLLIQYPNLPIFATANLAYIKISAGWLIDNLGLKGFRHGNVGIYSKQALVLVNYGGACQTELLKFAEWIQSQVQNHYDLQLHIEPIILKGHARTHPG